MTVCQQRYGVSIDRWKWYCKIPLSAHGAVVGALLEPPVYGRGYRRFRSSRGGESSYCRYAIFLDTIQQTVLYYTSVQYRLLPFLQEQGRGQSKVKARGDGNCPFYEGRSMQVSKKSFPFEDNV